MAAADAYSSAESATAAAAAKSDAEDVADSAAGSGAADSGALIMVAVGCTRSLNGRGSLICSRVMPAVRLLAGMRGGLQGELPACLHTGGTDAAAMPERKKSDGSFLGESNAVASGLPQDKIRLNDG